MQSLQEVKFTSMSCTHSCCPSMHSSSQQQLWTAMFHALVLTAPAVMCRYFCGPDARKTSAQAKQERRRDRDGEAAEDGAEDGAAASGSEVSSASEASDASSSSEDDDEAPAAKPAAKGVSSASLGRGLVISGCPGRWCGKKGSLGLGDQFCIRGFVRPPAAQMRQVHLAQPTTMRRAELHTSMSRCKASAKLEAAAKSSLLTSSTGSAADENDSRESRPWDWPDCALSCADC